MALTDKLSTLGGMLQRAKESDELYEFIDVARGDERVIPMPLNMDDRMKTVSQMDSAIVELEAEHHRIGMEIDGLKGQRRNHALAIWSALQDAGVFSAIADDLKIAEMIRETNRVTRENDHG